MKIIIIILILMVTSLYSMELRAYRLYNTLGQEIEFERLISELKSYDVVFFGELHDNPIVHWLEYEVARSLIKEGDKELILGAEMFEADNQLIMDEYMQGLIKTRHFEENMRLWQNYQTDYKPLVELAKDQGVKFVATNIPRRYANIVAREGFEGVAKLSEEAMQFVAPMPVEFDPDLGCYAAMSKMEGIPHAMQNDNLAKAQAIKDATMAYKISSNYQPGKMFLHYNGKYHSDNHEGIAWYLDKYKPGLKIAVITSQLTEEADLPLGKTEIADYSIVIPEMMTRTYK